MSNAREIAMKVIYDVEFNGAYSNMALKKALKTDMPDICIFCRSMSSRNSVRQSLQRMSGFPTLMW